MKTKASDSNQGWWDGHWRRIHHNFLHFVQDKKSLYLRHCSVLLIAVCIYGLVMISTERSETAQKSTLEIWDKFSLRQNAVQDKIQSENFFPTVRKKFFFGLNFVLDCICLWLNFVLDWICLRLNFVSDCICLRLNFVLDWILSWTKFVWDWILSRITYRSCISYAIF